MKADSQVNIDSQVDAGSHASVDSQIKMSQAKAQLEDQKEVKVNIWP